MPARYDIYSCFESQANVLQSPDQQKETMAVQICIYINDSLSPTEATLFANHCAVWQMNPLSPKLLAAM